MDRSAPFLTATAWCLLGPAVFRKVMFIATKPGPTTAAENDRSYKNDFDTKCSHKYCSQQLFIDDWKFTCNIIVFLAFFNVHYNFISPDCFIITIVCMKQIFKYE